MKNGYGFDRLSRDALILALTLGFIGCVLFRWYPALILLVLSLLLTGFVLFRALSQSIEQRQDELLGYERITAGTAGFFKRLFKGRSGGAQKLREERDTAYKYFKCPDCGKKFRAPKGKGRIRVTCTGCGKQFEQKV